MEINLPKLAMQFLLKVLYSYIGICVSIHMYMCELLSDSDLLHKTRISENLCYSVTVLFLT